jgi:MoaA/NifB/PqqE/SkfB family radical SAM enzyme
VIFEKIIDSIKTVKKVGGTDIQLSSIFVAHRNNILELLEYVDLCCELRIDHIDVTGFISYGNEFSDLPVYSEKGNEAVDLIFSAAAERARNRGITLCYRGSRLQKKDFFCGSAHTVYITEEGDMTPCVVLARPTSMALRGVAGISRKIVFGNVFQISPEILWQTASYAFFRKQFFLGALPSPCELCPMAYGVIC